MPDTAAPWALITGASSGIGAAVARRLATRGYATLLVARRRDRLEALAHEIQTAAGHSIPAIPVVCDLADLDAVAPLAADLAQRHGPIDVLFNNAGFNINRPMLELTDEQLARIMAVNLEAPRRLITALLPGMLERRRGHVINIASIAARFGPWGHAPYAAAKAGLIAMTQSLACEHPHAESGVHFSYVNPGIVGTEFFDDPSYTAMTATHRRRVLQPEAVARRIVGLLDRPRLALYVPRHFRMLDLINALSPALALRMVRAGSRSPVLPSKHE